MQVYFHLGETISDLEILEIASQLKIDLKAEPSLLILINEIVIHFKGMEDDPWEFIINNEGIIYWINLKTLQTKRIYMHLEEAKSYIAEMKDRINQNSLQVKQYSRIPKIIKKYAKKESIEEVYKIVKEEAIEFTKKLIEYMLSDTESFSNPQNAIPSNDIHYNSSRQIGRASCRERV